jgi:ribosomal protein L1
MAEVKKAAKKTAAKTQKTKKEQIKKASVVVEAVPAEAPPEAKVEIEEKISSKDTAKAGKRSAKAQREDAEKAAKGARSNTATTEKEAKAEKKPTRPRHERAGKKYRQSFELVDKNRAYSLTDAVDLVIKTASTKFDSTVEMHVNLGVDPKQADQNIRENLVLPAGTGKAVRIAVMAEDDQATTAAGADITKSEDLLAQLDKEEINFDILIATPGSMAKLGKYARLLGPRGLMPNPKSGTVTSDVAKAVKEAKAGKVEYRVDESGIVHLGIGKVSFGQAKISQNAEAAISSIKGAKPASLKGIYIKSVYLTTTMGPSVKVDVA